MTFEVGKKYQTRDGRGEACFIGYVSDGLPVFELIYSKVSFVIKRQPDGRANLTGESVSDIVPVVEKISRFFNVYPTGSGERYRSGYFHDTAASAITAAESANSLGLIELKFEDGKLVGVESTV